MAAQMVLCWIVTSRVWSDIPHLVVECAIVGDSGIFCPFIPAESENGEKKW